MTNLHQHGKVLCNHTDKSVDLSHTVTRGPLRSVLDLEQARLVEFSRTD